MTKNKTNKENREAKASEFLEHYRIPYIKELCRKLRKNPTKSEALLWQALRNRKLAGLKFYRQHPFGRYIVDFYCHEKRLVVEVDGGIHLNKDIKEYDLERQKLIELYGVRFFRCTTAEVENDPERVLTEILKSSGIHLSPYGRKLPTGQATPSLRRKGLHGVKGESY